MPAPPNLPTNHVDNIGELITAGMINDLALAANSIYNRASRAFNVMAYGAVGNGIADDTAAIEATIAAMPLNADNNNLTAGMLYFPAGYYKTAHAIQIPRQAVICGDGYASKIFGAFADYVFVHDAAGSEGPLVIRDLRLSNSVAGGGCIRLAGVGNVKIESIHCSVGGGFAIFSDSNTYTVCIDNVKVVGAGFPAGQVGIVAQGHTTIRNCDLTGLTYGAVINGPTVNFMGCRVEVCKVGLYGGLATDLVTKVGLARSAIIGNSFEANDTHIHLCGGASLLAGCAFQGSANAPSGSSIYGVRLDTCTNLVVTGLNIGGAYTTAACLVEGPFNNTVLIGVNADSAGLPSWILPVSLVGLTFINCDTPGLAALSTSTIQTLSNAGVAPSIATAGTIATVGIGVSRVKPTTPVTGVILQVGTGNGQQIEIVNEAASANSITFATDATSNVADGLSIVIPGLRSRKFTWNATAARWFTT